MNARLAALLLFCAAGFAKEKDKAKQAAPATPPPKPSVTRATSQVAGAYVATAGVMAMKNDAGEHRADLFHVSYVRPNADPATRPVTFVFNGGPGSASLWLHMGTVGPRRVNLTSEGLPPPPPARAVDNAETWLDQTDLVFIDPVGTGYSRPAEGAKQTEFSGIDEDTRSVGDFIRRWIAEHKRWASPKFLCGESYGTLRAANLASHLQDRYGMYLSGIVLVSAVLDFQTIRGGGLNDLPPVLFLPSFAATAHFHGRLDAELQKRPLRELLDEVEAFALGAYLAALAQGDALPDERRRAVAAQVARYTGVSADFVLRSRLRLSQGRFGKELLRASGRTVGRFDSRITGMDGDAAGERASYDPSMAAINGPFSAAVKDYLSRDLRFESEAVYETLTGKVHPWSYKRFTNRYVSVVRELRRAMTKNRHLKVFVASGIYDLATPYFATDYTLRQLGLAKELRGHVRVRYYDAGHMMYIRDEDRKRLKTDVAEFYAWALPAAPAEAPAPPG